MDEKEDNSNVDQIIDQSVTDKDAGDDIIDITDNDVDNVDEGDDNDNNDNDKGDDSDDDDVFDFISSRRENRRKMLNLETDDKDQENYIYGIDLGTTNSCISLWRNDKVEIIPDEYGNTTVPSMVGYTNISTYVGIDAKNQKSINTENVFYEVKRLIGRKFDDKVVKDEMDMLAYKIVDDGKGGVGLQSTLKDDRVFTPEEISANVLVKLKTMAKRYMKTDNIKDVVITIPANFNDGQREATMDAARIAGLNPIMLLNEPTAAALAYGMQNRAKILKDQRQKERDEKRQKEREERERLYNERLGLDVKGADEMSSEDDSDDDSDEITSDSDSDTDSSDTDESSMGDDYLTLLVYDFGGGTLDVSLLEVYDSTFEVKASAGNTHFGGADFDDRIMTFCLDKFKKRHKYKKLLIPNLSLQKLKKECENAKKLLSERTKAYIAVKNFYDGKDMFISLTRKQFEMICSDLFVVCLSPIDDVLQDTHTEMGEVDEIILVGGMTRIPYIRQLIKKRFGKDGNFTVNPNEAISVGAAVQGYIYKYRDDPIVDKIGLIDVTSLSLGVETIGEVMEVLVPRRTMLPCEKSKMFTTDTDDMESVTIKIFEGERSLTRQNYFVGEFELGNIPPAPRGYPEIEVKFSIDTNGIISVTATDIDTEESSSITVTGNKNRLSDREIEELIERCRFQEHMDDITRMKKYYHFDIEDLCKTVIENINKDEYRLKEKDIKAITMDINNQLAWLNSKSYMERELDELEDVTSKLEDKYGTLILRGDIRFDKVAENNAENGNLQKTTLHGDEEDDEKEMNMVFKKIEEDELGLIGMTDTEKDELKEYRNNLIALCGSILEVLDSGNLLIKEEHLDELGEYVNDSMMWLHSHEKPSKLEYRLKIEDIDEACNTIMGLYENQEEGIFKKNEIVESNENVISELENLCLSLQIMIENGTLPMDLDTEEGENDMKLLKSLIDSNVEWIFENVHNRHTKKKEERIKMDEVYRISKTRLQDLNNLCDDIYTRDVQNIYIDKSVIVVGDEQTESVNGDDVKDDNEDNSNDVPVCTTNVPTHVPGIMPSFTGGTSIADIIKMRQKEDMERLINEEDDEEDDFEIREEMMNRDQSGDTPDTPLDTPESTEN